MDEQNQPLLDKSKSINNEDVVLDSLEWSKDIEDLLAKWCDHSKCYEWMHAKTFDLYYKKARIFMIFINILTTVSGLSNVIVGGITINGFQIAWIFGSISILVSTLNILQDKLGYANLAESHRKLINDWAIIRNKIEEILIIPPYYRKDCKTFLKYIKQDINNAILVKNATIPQSIREECFVKFKAIDKFNIPDICGDIEHTKTYTVISLKN